MAKRKFVLTEKEQKERTQAHQRCRVVLCRAWESKNGFMPVYAERDHSRKQKS